MESRLKIAVMLVLLVFSVFVNVNLFVPSVYSWTPLEGHITQDTTLTIADSPYRVINDVVVDAGVKLTIEPGVKVEFADGFSLVVNGTLSAVGTTERFISFTSSKHDPNPGVWDTIEFIGGKGESFTMRHSVITYAQNGITIATEDGYATIEKSEILNNSESGIMIKGKSHVSIKENIIKLNKNGINTDDVPSHSDILILGNTFSSNHENGIYLHSKGPSLGIGYLHDVIVLSNTILSNGENGMYLYSSGTSNSGLLYNVTILSNSIRSNGDRGIYLYASGSGYGSGRLHNVTISSNTVSSNGGNGVQIRTYRSNNVTVSSNTVSSNGGNGLQLTSSSRTYLYNVTVQSNAILSNGENGMYLYAPGLTIWKNTISANYQKGVWALEWMNLSRNTISYSEYGVFYSFSTKDNEAEYNDIYGNTYGMNVTSGATVNAEHNYWGHSLGPHHPAINPEGKGNSVNGDGTDLDFVPWLTSPQGDINQRPTAVLSAENTAGVNNDVTFDGSASTDDGRIDYYFFDFGDGKDSGWTTLSVVKHKYTSTGVYIANLAVMDDFGVKSTNVATWEITVVEFLTPLFIFLTLDPNSVSSEGQITVRAFVTDEPEVVEGASVQFESDKGGTFSSASGLTDGYGEFSATFTAPTVSEQTNVRITATASKGGYADSSDYEYLSVRYWAGSYIDTYQIQVGPWTKKVAEIHVSAEDVDASGTSSYASVVEILAKGGEEISGYVPLGGSFFSTIFKEIGKAVAGNPDGSFDFTALELAGDIGWFYAGSRSEGTVKEFPLSWYPIPISLFELSNPGFFRLFFESTEPEDATELSGQENAIVSLHDPDGRLYLHVYDSEGHHVGVDYTTNQTVTEIQGAFYIEWDSNTTIVLPSDVTEFRYAVDATYAHYAEENYSLSIIGAKNGLISSMKSLNYTIKLGEEQENGVQILSDFTQVNFMSKIFDIKIPSEISIGEQLRAEVNASDYEGIKNVFLKLLDPTDKWHSHSAELDNGIYTFNIETTGLNVGTYEAHVEVEDVDGARVKSVTYSLIVNPDLTIPLSVSVTANPSTIQSGKTSAISTQVTYSGNPVSGATVTFSSNKGGTFTQTSGTTNSNGYFTTAFATPTANTQTTVTITAEATKTGYLDGQDQTNITVNPSQPPPPEDGTPVWIYLIILIVILSIIGGGIAITRRRGHRPKETANL